MAEPMSDTALSRLNMVESQIRPSDVTDRRISRTMLALPREEFVPQQLKPVCYMDRDLVLPAEGDRGVARAMLAPRTLAKMIQALEIDEDGTVLDIGCGTGYSSSVLSHLAKSVFALEEDGGHAARARETLKALEIGNVDVRVGPLAAGLADEAPFDAILINGTVDFVPAALLDQLKDGGRLVAILAGDGIGRATQWLRISGRFGQASLFDASAPKLPEFTKAGGFVF